MTFHFFFYLTYYFEASRLISSSIKCRCICCNHQMTLYLLQPSKETENRDVPVHIVKLFIFWNREQEFMVRWGNSLSMTLRCSNGIRQGGQLSPLFDNVYTDDLNHHLQATGVGCYVGGVWVNSLSYVDDVVWSANFLTA